MIFPRYHQLDSVTKMLEKEKKNGAGKNYLIQHSAGSGKSNSIAWLAYGLSNLFDRYNESIFRSVIVVTDRRVLDSQLQDTIYQFDHVKGTVVKIDRNKTSKDLRDAINSGAKVPFKMYGANFIKEIDISDVASGLQVFSIANAYSSEVGPVITKVNIGVKVAQQDANTYTG